MKMTKIEGSEKETEVRRPTGKPVRRVGRDAERIPVRSSDRVRTSHIKLYSNNYLSMRKLFPDCDLKLPMHKASPRPESFSLPRASRVASYEHAREL